MSKMDELHEAMKEAFLVNAELGLWVNWKNDYFVYATEAGEAGDEKGYLLTYCKGEELAYQVDSFQTLETMVDDMLMICMDADQWREIEAEDD